MIYCTNWDIKSFLQVTKDEYLFLGVLFQRRKSRNDGWVSFTQQEVIDYLEVSPRQFTRIVQALQNRRIPLIEKKTKTGNNFRISAHLEEVITDKDTWLLTRDKYSCWDNMASAIMAETENTASAKLAETSAIMAEATNIYNNTNTSDAFSFTGTSSENPITQSTPAPSSPNVTKSTNLRWQKRSELAQALLQIVRRDDFENTQKERNGLLNQLLDLSDSLGMVEFTARVSRLMADEFERKHMGKLHYILKKVRGMEQVTRRQDQIEVNPREYED